MQLACRLALVLPNVYSMQPPLPELTKSPEPPSSEERAATRVEHRKMWKRADAWAWRALKSWWFWLLVLPLIFAVLSFVGLALTPETNLNYWFRDQFIITHLKLRRWFR